MVSHNPMFKNHADIQFVGIKNGDAAFEICIRFACKTRILERKHSLNNVNAILDKAERVGNRGIQGELKRAINTFKRASAPTHNL